MSVGKTQLTSRGSAYMGVAVRRIGGRTKQEARIETTGSSLMCVRRTLTKLNSENQYVATSQSSFLLDPAVEPRDDKVDLKSGSARSILIPTAMGSLAGMTKFTGNCRGSRNDGCGEFPSIEYRWHLARPHVIAATAF